ncbi:hypothetical protein ACR820_05850 [Streptomyces netropsis]
MAALRATLAAAREDIVGRYRAGTSMNTLAAEFGMGPTLLADFFDQWGEPRRDKAAAARIQRATSQRQT